MLRYIKSIFAAKPPIQLQHPTLGLLTLESQLWSGVFEGSGKSIEFSVAGKRVGPDPVLVEHLTTVLAKLPEIEQRGLEFLRNLAKDSTAPFDLRFLDFLWEDKPQWYSLGFTLAGDEFGIWRVEFEYDEPRSSSRDDKRQESRRKSVSLSLKHKMGDRFDLGRLATRVAVVLLMGLTVVLCGCGAVTGKRHPGPSKAVLLDFVEAERIARAKFEHEAGAEVRDYRLVSIVDFPSEWSFVYDLLVPLPETFVTCSVDKRNRKFSWGGAGPPQREVGRRTHGSVDSFFFAEGLARKQLTEDLGADAARYRLRAIHAFDGHMVVAYDLEKRSPQSWIAYKVTEGGATVSRWTRRER